MFVCVFVWGERVHKTMCDGFECLFLIHCVALYSSNIISVDAMLCQAKCDLNLWTCVERLHSRVCVCVFLCAMHWVQIEKRDRFVWLRLNEENKSEKLYQKRMHKNNAETKNDRIRCENVARSKSNLYDFLIVFDKVETYYHLSIRQTDKVRNKNITFWYNKRVHHFAFAPEKEWKFATYSKRKNLFLLHRNAKQSC